MLWLIIDIVLVGLALLVLALVLLKVWRAVKALGRQVGQSSATLTSLTDALPQRGAAR